MTGGQGCGVSVGAREFGVIGGVRVNDADGVNGVVVNDDEATDGEVKVNGGVHDGVLGDDLHDLAPAEVRQSCPCLPSCLSRRGTLISHSSRLLPSRFSLVRPSEETSLEGFSSETSLVTSSGETSLEGFSSETSLVTSYGETSFPHRPL